MAFKILVCGGRKYADHVTVAKVLSEAIGEQRWPIIIQGGAPGADRLAKAWAAAEQHHCVELPACWVRWKNGAGPIRNRMMLELGPELVVAFPGGAGTRDMVAKAKAAGIPVIEV